MQTKVMGNRVLCVILTIAMFFSFIAVSVPNEAKAASTTGFYVDGTTIRDANGNAFVMRGVNHAYVWYQGYTDQAIKGIAARGANTVRLVLGDGDKYAKVSSSKIESLIKTCINYKVVPVLEIHDPTGEDGTSYLDNAVNYWLEIKSILNTYEKYVIVNITNEWMGSWNGSGWASGYQSAIKTLRSNGINNMLIVDAPGWGQDYNNCKNYCSSVFNADTQKNTVFAIHMYGSAGGSQSKIKSAIDGVLGKGYPVIVGEFGYKHTDGDVDEQYIMQYCNEKNVGYLGWSWKGNSGGVEYLDIANDWSGNSLSSDWG
ncbi:MAG: glycoside hydrolase family 5 protein, partial [Oscillospiraceae bacterium]